MLNRRALLRGTAALVLARPGVARSQPAKMFRVGVLRPAPDDPVFRHNFEPFRLAFREKGFQEGVNLVMEYRVRAGGTGQIFQMASELVRLNVDAILALAPAAVAAAARATTSIPIVAVGLETDPIAGGFATSLASPGGNVTGLFLDFPELGGKWMELLKAAVPSLSRVALLWDPATGPSLLGGAEVSAPSLGLQALPLRARAPSDFAEAFRAAAAWPAGAMLMLSSPVFNSGRAQLADLAMKHRMPALMPFTGFAEAGGLMAYGPHLGAMFRQAAEIMIVLLRGGRPQHTPIERPARFELTVNLKTARALGLTIPPSLLLRADHVIG